MVGPDGDALPQERWHRKYRRSAYAGERRTPRHLVGNGVTVLLLRAFLARPIPRHSRHIVCRHRHRHGAHAHWHRNREGDDEGKKHAGDRLRHDRIAIAGVTSIQADARLSPPTGVSTPRVLRLNRVTGLSRICDFVRQDERPKRLEPNDSMGFSNGRSREGFRMPALRERRPR
jgi:hypothetical protein